MMRQTMLWTLLSLAALAFPAAGAGPGDPALRETTCSVPAMVEKLRSALRSGSPALQKYSRTLLTESALAMTPEALIAAIDREREPAVLEVLGAALATKASNTGDPKLVAPLLQRASRDPDPAVRAAAVRGLHGSASVETLAKNGDVTSYERLVQDPSPEVRKAAAANVANESENITFGHSRPVADAAADLAAKTRDPEVTAELLRKVSMEQAGPEAVSQVQGQLRSDSPDVRAAAAAALGGVSGSEATGAKSALLGQLGNERDPAVRKAILGAIVHLGFRGAIPTLESLRGTDPSLAPEIDAWLRALRSPVQEWSLLEREKLRPLK